MKFPGEQIVKFWFKSDTISLLESDRSYTLNMVRKPAKQSVLTSPPNEDPNCTCEKRAYVNWEARFFDFTEEPFCQIDKDDAVDPAVAVYTTPILYTSDCCWGSVW